MKKLVIVIIGLFLISVFLSYLNEFVTGNPLNGHVIKQESNCCCYWEDKAAEGTCVDLKDGTLNGQKAQCAKQKNSVFIAKSCDYVKSKL